MNIDTETPSEPFDPAEALKALDLPVPQLVEVAQPLTPEHPAAVAAAEAGFKVITNQDDLREYLVNEGLNPQAVGDLLLGKVTTESGNPKDLIGATKPDLSLVPQAALLHTAAAMMDGAQKYGPYNWRQNPVKLRVYVAAAQRHLAQYLDGEDFDPISGVHHLGHAIACAAILLDAKETGNLVDDRPLPGPAGAMIRRWTPVSKFE
jgi:hypothetical protein